MAGLGAALCAGAAAAQPSAADWSGFYLGLNGGWNGGGLSSHSSLFTVNQLSGVRAGAGAVIVPPVIVPGRQRDVTGGGFKGGGQIGFNAIAGPLVWGLEGDFDGMTNSFTTFEAVTLPPTALTTSSSVVAVHQIQPLFEASIRGRVGFASGRTLFYATGGPAWVQMRQVTGYNYTPTVTPAVAAANPGATFGPFANSAQNTETRRGWTVGAGAEFLSTSNMTFGLEYRHTWADEFGGDRARNVANGVSEIGFTNFHDNAVLARINIKFGSGLHRFW